MTPPSLTWSQTPRAVSLTPQSQAPRGVSIIYYCTETIQVWVHPLHQDMNGFLKPALGIRSSVFQANRSFFVSERAIC